MVSAIGVKVKRTGVIYITVVMHYDKFTTEFCFVPVLAVIYIKPNEEGVAKISMIRTKGSNVQGMLICGLSNF